MAHHNDVAVSGYYPGCVVQGFAFGDRGRLHVSGFPDIAPQQIEGTAKADPGPCAGLEEHIAENGTIQHFGHAQAVCVRLHAICNLENLFDAITVKLLHAQDVIAAKIHCAASVSLFFGRLYGCVLSIDSNDNLT